MTIGLLVRLADGSDHTLSIGETPPEIAVDRFVRKHVPFVNDWVETTAGVMISRVHVVSVQLTNGPFVA